MPSVFDANYCQALGATAGALVQARRARGVVALRYVSV